ncbi:Fic family protein [Oscillospiraceae bacterium OttesenSCG-928-F05]|nr:Fic family protein [Oscillospiraceae bacterium OttesenSCG-928-F05]
MIADKFNLTRAQNEALAKKLLRESIYSGVKLEGSPITFPETITILDGVNVPGASLEDIQKILNLRDAWRELMNTLDEPLNLDYTCKINGLIARNESVEWGVLRYGSVGIGGTEYTPELPDRETASKAIEAILSDEARSVTERAIRLFMYATRAQLFWDGNKRTSMLIANKLLIVNGRGILTVPDKRLLEFNERLIAFYETDDYSKLDSFMAECCIEGMTIERQEPQKKNDDPTR